MKRGLLLCVLVVSSPACKDKAAERAAQTASASKFWPEAPKPTSKQGTRTFAYKPENITGYTLTATGGSLPGGKVRLDYSMMLALDFRAGKAANERDAHIAKLELAMDADGEKMKMRLDGEAMTITSGKEPPVEMKRGDSGPFDVGGMTDKPFTTLVFTAQNGVDIRSIEDHPFNTLGGTGDMLDNALVLFPDLPTQAVAPGHKWSVTRNTPVGATGSRVDITYNFEYLGDGACPSGAPACSLLAFTAASQDADVTSEGLKMRMSYGFAGKVFFDTERGIVDESRVRMDLDARAQGVDMKIGGTFIVKPTR